MKITINGVPAPQGSKVGFVRKGGGAGVRESSKAVGPWREAVRAETQRALADHAPFHEGAVWVEVTFRLPRPKGHHGAKGLRPSAPRHPAVKPDLDKLARAVLDGITAGGALRDDAQVSVLSVEKVYADEHQPGAVVRIGAMW